MKSKGVKKMVIITILVVNFITCLIARLIQGGRFTYDRSESPDYNGKMILIAGMLSQPESAYRFIEMPYGGKMYLNFSVFGYNPKTSGKQLASLTKSQDYVIGVSVGCKSIIFSHRPMVRRVLVNPMTHSIILKPKYQMLIQYLSPLAEVASYAIGWLAIIPFIKSDTGNYYSIALLVDQLYWMYYGDPHFNDLGLLNNTGVVISTEDEFLENDIIKGIYGGAMFEETETRHGHLANPHVADQYNEAINSLLAN